MSIIDDMKNLSEQQRRLITKSANRLLKKLPTAHTIIMTRRPGLKTASVLTDYELIIFVNGHAGVSDGLSDNVSGGANKSRVTKPSAYKIYGAARETYPVCNPGLNYIHSDRLVNEEEAEALSYGFRDVHVKTRRSFLECLAKHLMFFERRESMSVTTLNTTEMEKNHLHYYRLYMIFKSKTGYVLYSRDVQPIPTIHTRI